MISIVLADDHSIIIDTLKPCLEIEGIAVLGLATDGFQLLSVLEKAKPDIVLLDINMPQMDGLSASKKIGALYPHVKILFFSIYPGPKFINSLKTAGAAGFVCKTSSFTTVLEAIRVIADGGSWFGASGDFHSGENFLTPRENEILQFIAAGETSQSIAKTLCISNNTVESHRKNILKKLGLSGKTELLRYALEQKYKR